MSISSILSLRFYLCLLIWFPSIGCLAQDFTDFIPLAQTTELRVKFPSEHDAITSSDWRNDKYEFNRQTMVEVYKQVGDRNEKWDEQAIQFLDDTARYFAGLDEAKCEKIVRQNGENVIELGCNDPLVKYCHAATMVAGQPSEATVGKAMQMIEDAYPLLEARGYPANRCFAAANRLRLHYAADSKNKAKAKKYFDECWRLSLQSILQDDPQKPGTIVVAEAVIKFFHDIPLAVRGNYFFTAKKLEKESPWLVNVIGGELHIDKAWEGRGGGWAYDVTQEGWDEFYDHLRRAENCFTRAWKLSEKRPHPAAGMIAVSMGAAEQPNQAMQLWFERAIASQLDYYPAYHRLLNGLKPRWHGSHEQMIQLGRLSMQTQRYDTDVPFMLCQAVWMILGDLHNEDGDDILSQPELFEDIDLMCNRYIEFREKNQCTTQWWETVQLGFCYLTERWDRSKVLIDSLDGKLDEDALKRFPLKRQVVVSDVLMRRGPHHEEIAGSLQAIRDDRHAEAIVSLESLIKQDDLSEDVVHSLRGRLQAVHWEVAFENGEEVSLHSDNDLEGWEIVTGNWLRRSTGAIRGEAGESGLLLKCNADFGNHWILSGDLVRGGSRDSNKTAGVYLYDGRHREFAVVYSPAYQWVSYGWLGNLSANERPFRPKSKVVPFEIHFNDGTIDVWLDYRELVKGYELEEYQPDHALQIVIGSAVHYDDAVLTYRNVMIRRDEPIP